MFNIFCYGEHELDDKRTENEHNYMYGYLDVAVAKGSCAGGVTVTEDLLKKEGTEAGIRLERDPRAGVSEDAETGGIYCRI